MLDSTRRIRAQKKNDTPRLPSANVARLAFAEASFNLENSTTHLPYGLVHPSFGKRLRSQGKIRARINYLSHTHSQYQLSK